MSDASEHSDSEFYFLMKKKKKKEMRGGHMIKCLLTELGRAGREQIFGPRAKYFPVRPSHSVNKYILLRDRMNSASYDLRFSIPLLLMLPVNQAYCGGSRRERGDHPSMFVDKLR